MDSAPKLRVIGRHGVGVENIDCAAAAQRGIYVVNTPDANTQAVAEVTIGLMICLARRVCEAHQQVQDGDWKARHRLIGTELRARTLGIIGFGRIGRRIAQIAQNGFGMRVLFYDKARIECDHEQVALGSLLARADFVSVNLPKTPETQGLIGVEMLSRMKRGSFLINASRGGIVDEGGVAEMLDRGHLGGAAFDVFAHEPIERENPLLNSPRIILLPHMAAHSRQAMIAMSMVAEEVIHVLSGKKPCCPVNLPKRPKGMLEADAEL